MSGARFKSLNYPDAPGIARQERYNMWNWTKDRDRTYFTDELRQKIVPLVQGRRIEFRYRCKPGGRTKKVTGIFVYLSHKPERGFRLHLKKVRWLGHYWPIDMIFFCDKIIWTQRYDFVPLLAAPRDRNLLKK